MMARDALSSLDELEVGRAVICGLSMGGYVALEFARLFPSRLSGLILAGTRAPADTQAEKDVRMQQVESIRASGMNGVAKASVAKLLAPKTLANMPDVVEEVSAMIRNTPPEGAVAAQKGMSARRDYTDDLKLIEVPALIIVGREDAIRPVSDAEFMHDRIRNSRLEIIEDAAHMTNMEQPEKFNRVMLEFLRSIESASQ